MVPAAVAAAWLNCWLQFPAHTCAVGCLRRVGYPVSDLEKLRECCRDLSWPTESCCGWYCTCRQNKLATRKPRDPKTEVATSCQKAKRRSGESRSGVTGRRPLSAGLLLPPFFAAIALQIISPRTTTCKIAGGRAPIHHYWLLDCSIVCRTVPNPNSAPSF